MRLTKSTIIFLISIIVLSMLFANVANILSTDQKYGDSYKQRQPLNSLKMTDSANHLLWFLQVNIFNIKI